jgi:hypothetical protein
MTTWSHPFSKRYLASRGIKNVAVTAGYIDAAAREKLYTCS